MADLHMLHHDFHIQKIVIFQLYSYVKLPEGNQLKAHLSNLAGKQQRTKSWRPSPAFVTN